MNLEKIKALTTGLLASTGNSSTRIVSVEAFPSGWALHRTKYVKSAGVKAAQRHATRIRNRRRLGNA